MVGATLKAHGGNTGNTGSDFYLVCLNDLVPAAYDPFFLGWDRQNVPSPEGVCIHHPQGDIKKISTYDQSTVSSQWSNNGVQSHWMVSWTETPDGHGVTESGSSGSPLFNEHGLIVGTLTGGESSCGNTEGADFYGKFFYHWTSNGSQTGDQLEPWLDPDHEGALVLGGTYYENVVVALFKADTTVVPVKGKIEFKDLSSGKPEQWQWYFEGGNPSASMVQNPEGIMYSNYGTYDVRLISGNEIMGPLSGNLSTGQTGIYMTFGTTNTKIRQNKIHGFFHNSDDGWGATGIWYAAEATSVTEISNNVIYDIKSYGINPGCGQNIVYGIFVRSGGNVKILHNTI